MARRMAKAGQLRVGDGDVPFGPRLQADLASLGVARLGKEYILPVTVNKATRQAAVIADLEPDAAQKLCAAYKAKKLFCEVKKPTDFVAPFGAFWR